MLRLSLFWFILYTLCVCRALSLWIQERKGLKSMLGSWSPQSCVKSSCWVTECLDQSIRYWWLSIQSSSCIFNLIHLPNDTLVTISYHTGHLDSWGRYSEASCGHKGDPWSLWTADLQWADRCKKTWLLCVKYSLMVGLEGLWLLCKVSLDLQKLQPKVTSQITPAAEVAYIRLYRSIWGSFFCNIPNTYRHILYYRSLSLKFKRCVWIFLILPFTHGSIVTAVNPSWRATNFNQPSQLSTRSEYLIHSQPLTLSYLSKSLLIEPEFSPAAHDDDGEFGPHKCCQDFGCLSWRQPAARHPAQQSGLPAGARQELQEQSQSAEAAELVCSNRKGKRTNFVHM